MKKPNIESLINSNLDKVSKIGEIIFNEYGNFMYKKFQKNLENKISEIQDKPDVEKSMLLFIAANVFKNTLMN